MNSNYYNSILMNFIQETCNQIVVPPKLKYSTIDLGYAVSNFGRRYDFQVRNNDNQNLKCSLYVPKKQHTSKICVIYLHSMNGSRLQCKYLVQGMLIKFCKEVYSCVALISVVVAILKVEVFLLGANQKYDISAVIEELVAKYGLTRYILWGRSMGAVTCLKYCEMMMNNYALVQIHGIILDSPFQSLKKLIIQLGAQRSDLPKFFVHAFYLLIQSTLQKKGNFVIDDLELVKSIKAIQGIPICFMVSKDDKTIDASHSQALYNAYKYWDKRLVYFSGLHHESRDEQYMANVLAFVQDKKNRANETKRSLKYKRILLEQEIVRRSVGQDNEKIGKCECNIFTNH